MNLDDSSDVSIAYTLTNTVVLFEKQAVLKGRC